MTSTASRSVALRGAPGDERLNRVRWRAGRRGHYEVWYLTVQDPASGWSFWFRYTLSAPSDASRPPEASLWAFTFPPKDEPGGEAGGGEASPLALQLLDHYPIARFGDASGPGGFAIELGPGRFALGGGAGAARGEVGEGSRRVAWDLRLADGAGSFRHVHPLLYRLRVAGTAVATPALRLSVSGTVRVGERELVLSEALGEQGHVFGRRHAERWAWAHCHLFRDAPGAVFEGVSAQVRKLGLLLPAASPFLFREPGGAEHAFSGARRMWQVQSEFALGRWSFEGRGRELAVRGQFTCRPEDFVSVEYLDPDGTPAYCNHTESANLTVELLRRDPAGGGDGWRVERRYEAPGAAAFEYGERSRDPRRGRRLDQADARWL